MREVCGVELEEVVECGVMWCGVAWREEECEFECRFFQVCVYVCVPVAVFFLIHPPSDSDMCILLIHYLFLLDSSNFNLDFSDVHALFSSIKIMTVEYRAVNLEPVFTRWEKRKQLRRFA